MKLSPAKSQPLTEDEINRLPPYAVVRIDDFLGGEYLESLVIPVVHAHQYENRRWVKDYAGWTCNFYRIG
jgi:hypothetical protein